MSFYTVNYKDLQALVKNIFSSVGFADEDSQTISEVLVAAELRGIPSHGISRIADYLHLIKNGRVKVNAKIERIHETPSTALLDGDSCMGMLAGRLAMQIAIDKAEQVGTGWVAVRNSNHFGIAGYYAMLALEHDMAGFAVTNANPLVAPTHSLSRLLGTNPIAFAVPAGKYPPFVADFATTPIARGKLALSEKKGEKVALGFVQDKHGNPSDNPAILKEGGAMLPLGGDYEHGSHKGYCLGAMVDILSAVFSGAGFGPFVPPSVAYLPMPPEGHGIGTGHFFGAIRIDAFRPADEFKKNMDDWIETFRSAQPIKAEQPVLIPGEPERMNEEKYKTEGIPVHSLLYDELKKICGELKIDFIL